MFIELLRGLEDPKDSSFDRRFYLLERCAIVKAFVLLVDETGVYDDLLVELFRTLIAAAE